MLFLVIYAGGKEREGCSREDWFSLPPEGIVRIAQLCAPQLPPGGDGYWMDGSGVINHSNSLMALERMANRRGLAIGLKYGETVSYSEWNATDARVMRWLSEHTEDCGCGD